MEYKEVYEIANRANSIGELYLKAYNKFVSANKLSRIERDEILNNLYHVVHATQFICEDEIVQRAKKEPFVHGADIIISAEVYATSIADEAEMLREVICNLIAKVEEGAFYPKFKFKRDMRKIGKHQKNTVHYKAIIDKDYIRYVMNFGNNYID